MEENGGASYDGEEVGDDLAQLANVGELPGAMPPAGDLPGPNSRPSNSQYTGALRCMWVYWERDGGAFRLIGGSLEDGLMGGSLEDGLIRGSLGLRGGLSPSPWVCVCSNASPPLSPWVRLYLEYLIEELERLEDDREDGHEPAVGGEGRFLEREPQVEH